MLTSGWRVDRSNQTDGVLRKYSNVFLWLCLPTIVDTRRKATYTMGSDWLSQCAWGLVWSRALSTGRCYTWRLKKHLSVESLVIFLVKHFIDRGAFVFTIGGQTNWNASTVVLWHVFSRWFLTVTNCKIYVIPIKQHAEVPSITT